MCSIVKLCVYLYVILIINTYFINASTVSNLLAFVLVSFTYYMHRKLILFCEEKLQILEEQNDVYKNTNGKFLYNLVQINCAESYSAPLINFPVVWSNSAAVDGYLDTPFLAACRNGDTNVVLQLLKAGADRLEMNQFGEGAIFLATYNLILHPDKKDASCIWVLYHAGCPINVKNNDGFTALHLAASYGHCALLKWLLSKGADVRIEPVAAGLALAKGYKKAAALLLKADGHAKLVK